MIKFFPFLFCFFVLIVVVKAGSCSSDERSYPLIFVSCNVLYSDLSSGASFTLHSADTGTSQYRIISVASDASSSTGFGGLLANRNIYIGTSGDHKWTMSATNLASVGTNSFSTAQGFDPSNTDNAIGETSAGADIIIQNYGGTTDYTSGELVLQMFIIETA